MAFIETQITPEMVKKYDMKKDYEILKNHSIKDFYTYGLKDYYWGIKPSVYIHLDDLESNNIIIDKSKDCYLRYGCIGSYGGMGVLSHTYFLLYCSDQRFYFVEEQKSFKPDDIENKISYSEHCIIQVNSLKPIEHSKDLLPFLEESLNIYYQSIGEWSYVNQFNLISNSIKSSK